MERKRWDIDERGSGVASGDPLPNVADLAEAMRGRGCVTADPEVHLPPARNDTFASPREAALA